MSAPRASTPAIDRTIARTATRANTSGAAAALVLLVALASSTPAQTRPGDNQRALSVAEMVDQLQRDARLSDAAQLLDAALDQGLLGEAAAWFAEERELVERERASRNVTPLEWFHANTRASRLMLAREDYLALVQAVESWLKDPAYSGPSHETEAAQLRLRLALGLRELEQNDPARSPTAEAMLREVSRDVPLSDRPVALLRLAEMRLRDDDTAAARAFLQQAEDLLQRSSGELTDTLQAEPLLLAALQARTERLAGSSPQILAERTAAIDDQLNRFCSHWAARPLREGGYGPLQFTPILTLLGERIELQLLAGETEDTLAAALGELMRVAALGSLARTLDAPIPTLEEIRKEVLGDDPRHGVLIYSPSPWATHLFLLDASTLRHLELARDDVIEETRRALARQLARGPQASDDRSRREQQALCAELAGLLLPDALWSSAASWQRLSIVGTDVLGEVPFEMLPTQDGLPLGQRFAVDRLPSLPLALALARRDSELPSEGSVTLLVANQPSAQALALAPDLPSLPLGEEDAAALLADYADGSQVVLCGDQARFEMLTRASSTLTPRIWQIIAHGVADNSGELGVGLALGAVVAVDVLHDHPGTLIAASAVVRRGMGRLVFVELSPGLYQSREVQLGARDSESVVLLSGVTSGEHVVVRGATSPLTASSGPRARIQPS